MFHLSRRTTANPTGEYLIEARSVVKTFKTAAGPFTALKEVNLRVNRGEFVAIIGKSGSGKSTLLNMLTGIDRPTAGEVFVDDTPIHTLSEGRLAKWRGKHLGIVFQFFQLLPTLTLLENVMLPMDLCGLYSRANAKSGPWACSNWWRWAIRRTSCPRRFRADSSSAWRLRARWRTIRPSSSPMNLPAISIQKPPNRSLICLKC